MTAAAGPMRLAMRQLLPAEPRSPDVSTEHETPGQVASVGIAEVAGSQSRVTGFAPLDWPPDTGDSELNRRSAHHGMTRPTPRTTDHGPRAQHAFTLIELMLVSALLAVIVGMAVVRLDGFSEQGRIRAAGRQIAMLYRTARFQAITEGRPRMVEYLCSEEVGTRIRIHAPHLVGNEVEWTGGEGFVVAGGVQIGPVVAQVTPASNAPDSEQRIRIGSDGMAVAHAAVLKLRGVPRAAVVIDGVTGDDRLVWIDDPGRIDVRGLLETAP